MLIMLENNDMIVAFRDEDGAFVGLTSKHTQRAILVSAKTVCPFELHAPLAGQRMHLIRGSAESLVEIVRGHEPNSLRIRWARPRGDDGTAYDIELTIKVAMRQDRLVFDSVLTNRSALTIESVRYPVLGALSYAADETVELLTPAYIGMDKKQLYPRFENERGYWGVDYPIKIVSDPYNAFLSVERGKEGVYIGLEEANPRMLGEYHFQLKPGNRSVIGHTAPPPQIKTAGDLSAEIVTDVVQFPFAAPQSTVPLLPISLSVYQGDWRQAAKLYAAWRVSWFRPAPSPDWVHAPHAWFQLQLYNSDQQMRCRYSELVAYAETCMRNGISVMQIDGWTENGMDGATPSHSHEPALGTQEELCEAIRRIRELGIHVVLYCKYVFADTGTAWFCEELSRWASCDSFGNIHSFCGYNYGSPSQLAGINTHRLAIMCYNSEGWQKTVLREHEKTVSLGADGILFDECFHHGNMRYCFAPNHGHAVPAFNCAGNDRLDLALRQASPKNYVFGGEGLYDAEFQRYTVSYARLYQIEHMPLQRLLDSRAEILIAVWGYDDRETLNMILLYRYIISYEPKNFKGKLDDFPLTLAYGKRIDALRMRYRDVLWDGTFCDQAEAKVTDETGAAYAYYTTYRSAAGRRAVIVVNFAEREDIRLRVVMQGPTGNQIVVSPEDPEGKPFTGELHVAPRCAAIVMET